MHDRMGLLAAAVAENAAWCDLVCRTHGLRGHTDDEAWACATRTPPQHPDAVTLAATATARRVLGRVDVAPGCSVKDSWCTLDLTPAGFEVLFEATWVARSPGAPGHAPPGTGGLRWASIPDAAALQAWTEAGEDIGAAGVLLPDLLDAPDVVVLGGHRDGALVAGAVLHVAPAVAVVGASNVWSAEGDLAAAWAGAVAGAAEVAPRLPVVGYERDAALDAAAAVGCTSLGPLRVWLRP